MEDLESIKRAYESEKEGKLGLRGAAIINQLLTLVGVDNKPVRITYEQWQKELWFMTPYELRQQLIRLTHYGIITAWRQESSFDRAYLWSFDESHPLFEKISKDLKDIEWRRASK